MSLKIGHKVALHDTGELPSALHNTGELPSALHDTKDYTALVKIWRWYQNALSNKTLRLRVSTANKRIAKIIGYDKIGLGFRSSVPSTTYTVLRVMSL